jgi:hypothetical protein
MAIVTTQANASRQSGNFANQLSIPPRTTLHCSSPAPRLPLILLLFQRVQTWLTLKMANKRRKNRLMKKYFWRLGCVEARIRSDARRADLPPALRAGSIDDVAECGFASLIGPNGTNTFQVNPRTGLTAATATMRRTSN